MRPLRPAVAAVILTALLVVPADADHKRFGGFVFVEPFFVPVPELPLLGRGRQHSGYPVALVRRRLSGIGFSRIGRFDVYPGAYGVSATDPGGVRVNLVIDRWSGDIVRARAIKANRAPGKARAKTRKIAALRVPPLPRPAPERLTQTVSITPSAVADRLQPENTLPEIDPIGETTPMPLPLVETPPPVPEAAVEIAAVPVLPAIAEPDPVAEAIAIAPKPARPVITAPVTALQGERYDPADIRDPIAVY